MFAANYFPPAYFPPAYFPEHGTDVRPAPPVTYHGLDLSQDFHVAVNDDLDLSQDFAVALNDDLDLSGDYLVIDDMQTVTYFPKTGEGAYASGGYQVNYAFWEALNQLDYMTNPSLLEQQARVVNLWTVPLSGTGIVPKLGDKVVDQGGAAWYAQRVQYMDLDRSGVQRYRITLLEET